MKIQFVNLQRQNKRYQKRIFSILKRTIEKSDFVQGKPIETFEKAFAKFCKKKYAVSLNSGTDALKLSLMAYDIGKDDEVITVPNSYFSTAMVISELGAQPIFVDVDPGTHTLEPSNLQKALTKKTKAIIPVHLFGQPADMDPIFRFAKKNKLIVIEDACQAHGAYYKNQIVPVGETGTFSFYPSKNLGCFGDGGAVVTNNKTVAEKLLYLRNDGSVKKYIHTMFGIKSRLDVIQAEVLNFKLPYLPDWNRKRQKFAQIYSDLLKSIPQVKILPPAKYATHAFHLYVIETEQRDKLRVFLSKHGIETNIHYPIPIHLQEAYQGYKYKAGDFPITEKKAKLILSLPMFPELLESEIEYTCKKIKDFFKTTYDL